MSSRADRPARETTTSGARASFWNLVKSAQIETSAKFLKRGGQAMGGLIYLIGLIVVVLAILSFFGLH
jgi:hypothetical protein